MSDYNDGLLPEPCLRMDTHFGDEYESVEFGDGTGYVKAATALARLGALHVELDELRDGNAKLRELVNIIVFCANEESVSGCDGCAINGADMCATVPEWLFCDSLIERLRELGVEVDS